MITPDTKKQVIDRFNREAMVWKDVHSGEIVDIIQLEVKKRKEFVREFINERFHNQPVAMLEIGCGAGRNLEEILSDNAAWEGMGVDNASAMIDHCRTQYKDNPKLSFETLDIDSNSLDRQFDVIFLLGVVGYLGSNSVAFRNIQRMLRPGGYVIFTYGRGFSAARAVRAGVGLFRSGLSRMFQGKSNSPVRARPSFFRNYTFSDVKRAFPPEWRLVSHVNLVFGSGILKRTSVRISRLLEPLFTRFDPLRVALTSIVVVVNELKADAK